ncbi:hypothetical protein MXD58_024725, partial [Frankia sp. AgKG'84/4]
MDAVLRGDGPGPADAALIARRACAGLGRLPAVVGPVFHDADADPALLRRYRSGDLVVEPGFLTASTRPRPTPAPVRYVIWSSTARRTGLLIPDLTGSGEDPPDVLFAAGTRFVVLAVDPATGPVGGAGATPPGPGRQDANVPGRTPDRAALVLLREVIAGRADEAWDERALGRLRA